MSDIDKRTQSYQHLWTKDLDKSALLEDSEGNLVIRIDLEDGAPYVWDEDSEIVAIVYSKMRQAGVRVIRESDYISGSWRTEK